MFRSNQQVVTRFTCTIILSAKINIGLVLLKLAPSLNQGEGISYVKLNKII